MTKASNPPSNAKSSPLRAKKLPSHSISSKNIKLSFCEGFTIVLSVFLLCLLLKDPKGANISVSNALKICASTLIPSLFPLMVASEILIESGTLELLTKPLRPIFSKMLKVSEKAVSPYFLGLVGGYTTSVGGALSLYKNGQISKQDCERVIALSSLPSLSFLTGFVGVGVLQSSTSGWILWAIAIISTLIIGFFSKKSRVAHQTQNERVGMTDLRRPSPSKIIVGAISHSAYAMLLICACVVFFSTLVHTLHPLLHSIGIQDTAELVLLGSFEITQGVTSTKSISNSTLQAAFCAFFVGWSGLSVHFQIISLCDGYDLSYKKYFIIKLAQGIVCLLLTLLVFYFI